MESDRYFPGVCFGHEIGPDFRFNQNDCLGTDRGERVAHDRPEIKGAVHHLDPIGRALICESESRRGGRRQDAVLVRLQNANLPGQLQRNRYLADTDRMQPKRFLPV